MDPAGSEWFPWVEILACNKSCNKVCYVCLPRSCKDSLLIWTVCTVFLVASFHKRCVHDFLQSTTA